MTKTINLAPLGAGDLIDRAVRFYRGNFWTFIWIAAPPIIVGTIVSVGWTMIGRQIFSVGAARNTDELVGYYFFTWFGGILIWLIEMIATLTVMGGAARNFVRHLLFGEPVTFRETYKNTMKRLGGLIAASSLITFLLGFFGLIVFYLGIFVAAVAVMIAFAAFSFAPFVSIIVSLALSLAVAAGALWLFFLVASRLAYVPQVMLVEGLGVFSAVGRSASLASGNVKRLAGLFIFTAVAAYSALALLYIPLGWYAWANGAEFFAFNSDTIPAWYEIAGQFVWQTSLILLMPTWMIGLCLLYVDERVRHEGYDIELMAARRLGEIPAVPRQFVNPLQPALADRKLPNRSARKKNASTTPLGLE
ncbi:MAG TPA: hypothetical protein VNI84_14535 [Pyrinomonadaceae bacterium]|nr:hypothetical protein [Pyrinomonadaceae bacterium]